MNLIFIIYLKWFRVFVATSNAHLHSAHFYTGIHANELKPISLWTHLCLVLFTHMWMYVFYSKHCAVSFTINSHFSVTGLAFAMIVFSLSFHPFYRIIIFCFVGLRFERLVHFTLNLENESRLQHRHSYIRRDFICVSSTELLLNQIDTQQNSAHQKKFTYMSISFLIYQFFQLF